MVLQTAAKNSRALTALRAVALPVPCWSGMAARVTGGGGAAIYTEIRAV